MNALSVLAVVLVLLSGSAALRAARRAAVDAREAARARERERFVVATTGSLVDASRVSSAAVMRELAETIHRCDPSVDAVLAFAPNGNDLECVYTSGARVDHYARLRLARDAEAYLPARAAIAGHRVAGAEGTVIPTDRRALAVPMLDRGEVRAVVYASSALADAIVGDDVLVRAIECAAAPYAIALEREADRSHATYDALTGLLTPRAFRERLREEVERARVRRNAVMTLWFVDTDRFKSVNDTHGHAVGDAVLQKMAALLRAQAVPDLDVVARNGGDEFCALIFDAQKTVAIERAHAFCEAVRRHDFGTEPTITASVGVASFPYDAEDASGLLEIADAAMYHSKRGGRDRVSFAVDGNRFAEFR